MKPLKSYALACAVLLVVWPIWAAESPGPSTIAVPAFGLIESAKSQPIVLSGPASLGVGQDGVYRLTGTPAVDLSRPLLDQLGWAIGADRMYVWAMPPGLPKAALDVRLELVIAVEGVTLQPVIRYTPAVAGSHRLLVDWNHGQDQLAEYLIVVGGPQPNPEPGPQPNPNPQPNPQPDPNPTPPPTPGKRFVMIVRESGDPSLALARTLTGVTEYCLTKGHLWRIEDPDLKTAAGKTPAWFQAYQAAAVKAGIVPPQLFVGAVSSDGKQVTHVRVVPLPATPDAAVKVIQDSGG